MGGCAAQEAIKLLTNQFVPINNTLIYNGIKQSTTVYELWNSDWLDFSYFNYK